MTIQLCQRLGQPPKHSHQNERIRKGDAEFLCAPQPPPPSSHGLRDIQSSSPSLKLREALQQACPFRTTARLENGVEPKKDGASRHLAGRDDVSANLFWERSNHHSHHSLLHSVVLCVHLQVRPQPQLLQGGRFEPEPVDRFNPAHNDVPPFLRTPSNVIHQRSCNAHPVSKLDSSIRTYSRDRRKLQVAKGLAQGRHRARSRSGSSQWRGRRWWRWRRGRWRRFWHLSRQKKPTAKALRILRCHRCRTTMVTVARSSVEGSRVCHPSNLPEKPLLRLSQDPHPDVLDLFSSQLGTLYLVRPGLGRCFRHSSVLNSTDSGNHPLNRGRPERVDLWSQGLRQRWLQASGRKSSLLSQGSQ